MTDRRLCVRVCVCTFFSISDQFKKLPHFLSITPKASHLSVYCGLALFPPFIYHSSGFSFIYLLIYLLSYLLIYLFDCLFVCLYVHYLFINQPESESVTRQIVNCFILR